MTHHTLRKITLVAADVDIGDSGMPGTGETQIKCKITVTADGQWRAEGSYSTGSNQGSYQENYSYGPWVGAGASPESAVRDMVRRADDEYVDDMRRAGHDALTELAGATYAECAAREIERLQSLIDRGSRVTTSAVIGDTTYSVADEAEQIALRRRAIVRLRALAGLAEPPAITISDDALLAEARRRGLIPQT